MPEPRCGDGRDYLQFGQRSQVMHNRLLIAANALITRTGRCDITTEEVARSAGVSDGVAHLHFDNPKTLLVETTLDRARGVIEACNAVMERQHAFVDKLEYGLVYLTHALPQDPMLVELCRMGRSQLPDTEIMSAITSVAGVLLRAAQDSGELRRDVTIEEISRWLFDELLFMIAWRHPTTDRIVHRFRRFLVPGLKPPQADAATVAQYLHLVNASTAELQSYIRVLGDKPETA